MKKIILLFVISVAAITMNYADTQDEYPLNYTINLMWINRQLNQDQHYIHPATDTTAFYENFLSPIIGWATLNPKSSVTLWFDSAVTTDAAVKNTELIIKQHLQSVPAAAPILFKDVRKLPLVTQHPKIFTEEMPVYFRADLLRVIAMWHALVSNQTNFFVYSDFDVQPLPQAELFDQETIQLLKNYGTVLAHWNVDFENSFQITCNNKPNLIEAIEYALITLNIHRAYYALEHKLLHNHALPSFENRLRPLSQIVYHSHPSMFKYFYHLEKLGTIVIDDTAFGCNEAFFPYDKEKYGLLPFGLNEQRELTFITSEQSLCIDTQKIFELPETATNISVPIKIFIPTKPITQPPSQFK